MTKSKTFNYFKLQPSTHCFLPMFTFTERLLLFSFQNPREASRLSRIFLISLVYVCHTSWQNEKRHRLKIWYTYSHRRYKKRVFCFFEKISVTAASLEKLQCHVDFPHISSIALFLPYFDQ